MHKSASISEHLFDTNFRLKFNKTAPIYSKSASKNHKSASDPSLTCAQICVYICQICVYIKSASNNLRVPITNISLCPARLLFSLSSLSPLWSPVMPRTSSRSMKTVSSTPQWSRDTGWLGCQVDKSHDSDVIYVFCSPCSGSRLSSIQPS